MISRSHTNRRINGYGRAPLASTETFEPESRTRTAPQRGESLSLISVSGTLNSAVPPMLPVNDGLSLKPTKLLLNVNIERSFGPVQVVMPPESAVSELIKAALEIYVRDKRRPFLQKADPDAFELHYSQFSLESLKADEKLINLGSRNFFLCSKQPASVNSCCSDEANIPSNSPFPLAMLMHFMP